MEPANKKSGKKITGILPWFFTAAWMLVIFMLSAQPAAQSGGLSMGVTKVIAELVGFALHQNPEALTDPDWLHMLDGIIRECAHGAAYFILALLIENALKRHGLKGLKLLLFTLAFCAVYAASDEIHQLFVPGRACELFDFEIDMLGAVCSIVLAKVIRFAASRLRRNVIRL